MKEKTAAVGFKWVLITVDHRLGVIYLQQSSS